MSDFLGDPLRWKDRSDQARLAERAAGKMVRAMGQPEPLSGPQLARIAAGVRGQKSRPHRLRLWAPAMAVLLFGGVAAAYAARMDFLPRWLADIVRPGTVAPPSRAPALRARRTRSNPQTPTPAGPAQAPAHQAPISAAGPSSAAVTTVAPLQPVIPVVTQVLATEPAREAMPKPLTTASQAASQPSALRSPEGHRAQPKALSFSSSPASQPGEMARAPAPPAQPTAALIRSPSSVLPFEPTAPTPFSRPLAWADRPAHARPAEPLPMIPETRPAQPAPVPTDQGTGPLKHLSAAVHALRVEHSPLAALALLDRHAGELSSSSVGHEALLLRVEAMLKLDRRAEVLTLLDSAPLAGVAASRTLLLTRGELRASAGRCAEALADFDLVLAQTQGHNERALAGRAKCREKSGPPVP